MGLRERAFSYDCIAASLTQYKEDNLMLSMPKDEKMDKEWVALIEAARKLGLTPADIRFFLNKRSL